MTRLLPPLTFLCVGAPRTGTTTLHALLSRHPRIGLPRGKELPIFHKPDLSPDQWKSLVRAYWPAGKPILGKCTPQYWTEPHLPQRLKAWMPDTLLILGLRDPVERFWSEYRMYWRRGWEDRLPDDFVNDALDPGKLQEARQHSRLLGERDRAPYMALAGCYAELLERWWAWIPPEQWVLLFYEEWTRDPIPTLRSLWERIGVETPDLNHLPRENVSPPRGIAAHLARLGYAIHRRRDPREWLPRRWAARYESLLYWMVRHLRVRSDPPAPSRETLARLRAFYAPDEARLRDLLGRPLPWENRPRFHA